MTNPIPSEAETQKLFMSKAEMKTAHEIACWTGNAELTINKLIIKVSTLQNHIGTLEKQNTEMLAYFDKYHDAFECSTHDQGTLINLCELLCNEIKKIRSSLNS